MKTIKDVMEWACFLIDHITHWEAHDGWVDVTAEGETKRFSEMKIISIYSQSSTPLDFQGKFAQMWCDKRADNFLDDYILELRGRTLQEWVKKIERGDVKEVKRARWIKGKDWDDWFCSGCSNKANLDWRENPILSSFCPHCGAIMYIKDGEGEFAADPLPGTAVDREQFNRAANEIGDSIEDGNDKMAIAVFVNVLEERLFGGADE